MQPPTQDYPIFVSQRLFEQSQNSIITYNSTGFALATLMIILVVFRGWFIVTKEPADSYILYLWAKIHEANQLVGTIQYTRKDLDAQSKLLWILLTKTKIKPNEIVTIVSKSHSEYSTITNEMRKENEINLLYAIYKLPPFLKKMQIEGNHTAVDLDVINLLRDLSEYGIN